MIDSEIQNNNDTVQNNKQNSTEQKLNELDITKSDYKKTFDILNSSLNSLSVPLKRETELKKKFYEERQKLLDQEHIKTAISSGDPLPIEVFNLLDKYVNGPAEIIIDYQVLIIRQLRITLDKIQEQLPQIETVKQTTESMKSVVALHDSSKEQLKELMDNNNQNIAKQIENEQVMLDKKDLFFQTIIERLHTSHRKDIESLSKGLIKISGDVKDIKKNQKTLDDVKPVQIEEKPQVPANQGLFEVPEQQLDLIKDRITPTPQTPYNHDENKQYDEVEIDEN